METRSSWALGGPCVAHHPACRGLPSRPHPCVRPWAGLWEPLTPRASPSLRSQTKVKQESPRPSTRPSSRRARSPPTSCLRPGDVYYVNILAMFSGWRLASEHRQLGGLLAPRERKGSGRSRDSHSMTEAEHSCEASGPSPRETSLPEHCFVPECRPRWASPSCPPGS